MADRSGAAPLHHRKGKRQRDEPDDQIEEHVSGCDLRGNLDRDVAGHLCQTGERLAGVTGEIANGWVPIELAGMSLIGVVGIAGMAFAVNRRRPT